MSEKHTALYTEKNVEDLLLIEKQWKIEEDSIDRLFEGDEQSGER